jgi:hypothetical protein
VRFGLIVMLSVLASCGREHGEPKSAPRAAVFNPAWLPAANGTGNLLVCLDKDVAPEELEKVTMPDRLLFQSWGRQLGPLRNKESFDPNAMKMGLEANALSSYAVMTIEPLTVSQEQPCTKVRVRAAISQGFRWSHEVVPANLHFMFQVEDLEVTPDFKLEGQMKLPESSLVKQVLLGGSLFATPIAPIGDPFELGE